MRFSRTKAPVHGVRRAGAAAALAAGALFLVTACGGSADTEADGQPQLINDGQMVVAMSGEFRPFSHFEDNKLTGFDYDIAVAIADEMGLDLQTKTGAFDTLIQGLQSNR
jgi:polar amino acid transport system substrate-binding protein